MADILNLCPALGGLSSEGLKLIGTTGRASGSGSQGGDAYRQMHFVPSDDCTVVVMWDGQPTEVYAGNVSYYPSNAGFDESGQRVISAGGSGYYFNVYNLKRGQDVYFKMQWRKRNTGTYRFTLQGWVLSDAPGTFEVLTTG